MRFFGRTDVLAAIESSLDDDAEPRLTYLHGVPGIGKSLLLAQVAQRMAARGVRREVVDAQLPRTQRARRLSELLAPTETPTVVLADDWHTLQLDQAALLERLETARGPLVLLVASRFRPGPALLRSRLFPERVQVHELGGLDTEATLEMLGARGIPAERARAIHRVAGGHPFVSLLLGDSSDPLPDRTRLPDAVALSLVQPIAEDDELRDALPLIALAGVLNEHELREALGLGATAARALFDRLRSLSLVRTERSGLSLHPLVEAALVSDLLVRDPPRARAMVERLLAPIESALGWIGPPRARALRQLSCLIAVAPQDVSMAGMFELDGLDVSEGRPSDAPDALDLIEQHEGPASRAIAARWIEHDPHVLTVLRTPEGVQGVMVRAEVRGHQVPEPLREPALDALVATLAADGTLSPDGLLRATRFYLSRQHGQLPSQELGVLGAAMTRRTLDTPEPYISAQIFRPEGMAAWGEIITALGFRLLPEAEATVDGVRWIPCARGPDDLGLVFDGVCRSAWGIPMPAANPPAAAPATSTPPPPPSTDEVAEALRNMRDPIWLSGSPLAVYLFAEQPVEQRGASLQAWLEQAVASTGSMRKGDRILRAMQASFGADHSNEEAAHAAGMSLSTLKRYRRAGIAQVQELVSLGSMPEV